MGQTKSASTTIIVNATAGPLVVTSQSTTGITYASGSVQTVTWNVANTTALTGGTNVDILLSTDNGVTWNALASGIPNNGTASVTLPNIPTMITTCRFMVKAAANVFLAETAKTLQYKLALQQVILHYKTLKFIQILIEETLLLSLIIRLQVKLK